jgi:hypothetical protein
MQNLIFEGWRLNGTFNTTGANAGKQPEPSLGLTHKAKGQWVTPPSNPCQSCTPCPFTEPRNVKKMQTVSPGKTPPA